MKKFFKIIVSVIIPLGIGALGSIATNSSVGTWYTAINKPTFNPPNWIFGPVWTLLFILIGISFYLVWMKGFGKKPKKVIGIYFIQLFLNLLWSVCFFGLQNPSLALAEIGILWIAILLNIILFYKISKMAAYLLLPYILWVSFAIVLNAAIVVLN